MMKYWSWGKYVGIILLLCFGRLAMAQNLFPVGMNKTIAQSVTSQLLPPIDSAEISFWSESLSEKIATSTVGYNFQIDFNPNNVGTWTSIVPGVASWLLKLHSPNAYGLGMVFSSIRLLPGERLYVYNQYGMHGPFTQRDIPLSGILPLDFLQGDELMIEYDVPGNNAHRGSFVIETVSHAFRNIFTDKEQKRNVGTRYRDDCYLCLNDPALTEESRSVVKIVVQHEQTTTICTGTLMNNTAFDARPYVLTAEHCIASQSDAERAVFIFGFDDERCGFESSHELVLNGAMYRSSLSENDFSLVELYDTPPLEFRPYYAGWDISPKHVRGVVCIHHPQGGPKKVSISNDIVQTGNLNDGEVRTANAYWKVVRWDIGATEGGSSGAPLFNTNGHLIGSLSGGSSSCGVPYNDYFEKLSASWEASQDPGQQLKFWLDPVGSGTNKLDGLDPFEGISTTCQSLTNISPGEVQTLQPYPSGYGYFSGYNSDDIASYAERFTASGDALLSGVLLNVGSVNVTSPGGLLVSVHSSSDGLPGELLSQSYIPYNRLTENSSNRVVFYPYVEVSGEFFISYTLSYSTGDSFALLQSEWKAGSNNTAYAKLPASGWTPLTTISPGGAGASFGVTVTLCEEKIDLPPPVGESVTIYPNPAPTVLIARFSEVIDNDVSVRVYDLQGRQQNVLYSVYDNTVVITTADLNAGMYIVEIQTDQGRGKRKFVKL